MTALTAAIWLAIIAGVVAFWAAVGLSVLGFFGPAAIAAAKAIIAAIATLFIWAASRGVEA